MKYTRIHHIVIDLFLFSCWIFDLLAIEVGMGQNKTNLQGNKSLTGYCCLQIILVIFCFEILFHEMGSIAKGKSILVTDLDHSDTQIIEEKVLKRQPKKNTFETLSGNFSRRSRSAECSQLVRRKENAQQMWKNFKTTGPGLEGGSYLNHLVSFRSYFKLLYILIYYVHYETISSTVT